MRLDVGWPIEYHVAFLADSTVVKALYYGTQLASIPWRLGGNN